MRTIGRALLALCALVLFVIGALAFLLAFAPGPVKDGLSTVVTNLTGRNFRIDGRFQVEVGRQTTLTGTDLRLANAEWGAAEDIGRIGQAKIVLDLPALLRGHHRRVPGRRGPERGMNTCSRSTHAEPPLTVGSRTSRP